MSDQERAARPDFEAAGLVDGLDDEARRARLQLLERLADAGVGMSTLRAAVEQDRLVLLPAEQALGGTMRLSARELCERAGVRLEDFLAVRRAHGLVADDPDERLYSEQDLDAATAIAGFFDAGFDREGMLEAARVLGRGMAQLADALTSVSGRTFLKAGVSEDELALANAQAAREMLPQVTPVLEYVLRQHVRERLRHEAVSQAMLDTGELPGAQPIAVAFADLVAFTSLSERLTPEDVGDIAGRLGRLAADCAKPPVRLVKTIGDAAMLASPDAAALLRSTLELVEATDALEGFPRLRAGAAFGSALGRSGDWYGRPVNLASRIAGAAEPGTVVGTRELCDAAGAACRWTPVGSRSLKGIEDPVELFRVEGA